MSTASDFTFTLLDEADPIPASQGRSTSRQQHARRSSTSSAQERLVPLRDPKQQPMQYAPGAIEEFESALQKSEFKRLLNNIISRQFDTSFRSLTVLSCFHAEGRSLSTAAIALGYARYMRQSVLVIDAGSGKKLKPYYGFDGKTFERLGEQSRGLVHVCDPDTLSRCESEYDLNAYIHEMKQHYNLVIIDTSPLLEESGDFYDPILLASYADASILLQSKKSLERLTMKRVKDLFTRHDVHLVGSFFNQWG